MAPKAEIRACSSLGQSPPVPNCGNPFDGFAVEDLKELDRITRVEKIGLYKVLVDATGEVIWIEQWWSP